MPKLIDVYEALRQTMDMAQQCELNGIHDTLDFALLQLWPMLAGQRETACHQLRGQDDPDL